MLCGIQNGGDGFMPQLIGCSLNEIAEEFCSKVRERFLGLSRYKTRFEDDIDKTQMHPQSLTRKSMR
jgi:hypothetical protein